jgi:O-methyltransferase involved in polyketide biosynthesis
MNYQLLSELIVERRAGCRRSSSSRATQEDRVRRVKRALGTTPERVSYVPIDFNHETLDKLEAVGFDRSLPALFMRGGVTCSHAAQAVDPMLG